MTKTLKGLCSLSIDLQEKIKSYFKHKDRHVQILAENLFYKRVFKGNLSLEEAFQILERKINGDKATSAYRFFITVRNLGISYSVEHLRELVTTKISKIQILRSSESVKKIELSKEIEAYLACFEDSNNDINGKHIHLGLWLNHKITISQSDFSEIFPEVYKTMQIERMEHEFECIRYITKGFMYEGSVKKVICFSNPIQTNDKSLESKVLNANPLLKTLVKGIAKKRNNVIIENIEIILNISEEFTPIEILAASGNSLLKHYQKIKEMYENHLLLRENSQRSDIQRKLVEKNLSFENFFEQLKELYDKYYDKGISHSYHPMESIRKRMEIIFTAFKYGNSRPHKSLNLMDWSKAADMGKSTSIHVLRSVLFPSFQIPSSNNWVGFSNDHVLVYDHQFVLRNALEDPKEGSFWLKFLEGSKAVETCIGTINLEKLNLNIKFGHENKTNNPLIILQSNDDCSEQIIEDYAYYAARHKYSRRTKPIRDRLELLERYSSGACDTTEFLKEKQEKEDLLKRLKESFKQIEIDQKEIVEIEKKRWFSRFHVQRLDDNAFLEEHSIKCNCNQPIFQGIFEENSSNYGKWILRRMTSIFKVWMYMNVWYKQMYYSDEEVETAVYTIE